MEAAGAGLDLGHKDKHYVSRGHICTPFTLSHFLLYMNKLDGEGPVDNRPSTDKLHHIVKKKSDT